MQASPVDGASVAEQLIEEDLTQSELEMSSDSSDEDVWRTSEEEMIFQLKDKFSSTTSRSERMRVLTVLPKSWSSRKIAGEFGVSRYLARQAKKLIAENGILSSPNPKPRGRILSPTIAEKVSHFYLSDNVSRVMPGKKDSLSVLGEDGKRVHKQKRLLLCNLLEAYNTFKANHPECKIGFSTFAQLRPRECVLAGASGTHSVCVCTIQQNVKLMVEGSRLESLTDGEIKHYRHCLAAIQCDPPNIECHFGTCNECPEKLTANHQAVMDNNSVDTIEFKQWTTTDRATLEAKILPTDEFLDLFIATLKKLLLHDFIAKMQSSFVQAKKESLQDGEYLVIADFSENYSFVVQDEIQSFHWNNGSATIHPFVCYYRDKGELMSLCYIVISECLQHDTIAVHLFQKKLISFLTEQCNGKKPEKIFYVSDGCGAQYKNC